MKKKIKTGLSLCSLLLVISACGKGKNYDQSMQKAKEAIIERKFEQAEGFIELALESKPKDSQAKTYQSQLSSYSKGIEEIEKGEKKQAISQLDTVINTKNGSKKLAEYAKKDKEELEKKEKTQTSEVVETSTSKKTPITWIYLE